MFYIYEYIIKSLRYVIKFYILILYLIVLNFFNKKIRLFNDFFLLYWFYMFVFEVYVEFVLLSIFINYWLIKKIIIFYI